VNRRRHLLLALSAGLAGSAAPARAQTGAARLRRIGMPTSGLTTALARDGTMRLPMSPLEVMQHHIEWQLGGCQNCERYVGSGSRVVDRIGDNDGRFSAAC